MLIEQIQVKGYKSLVDATLYVKPLTLLAGTNSSGKSSIMQPLLLIKQTMEAPYQPAGALVLDGAHVQAETAEELISKLVSKNMFSVTISGYKYMQGLKSKSVFDFAYEKDNLEFKLIYQSSKHANEAPNRITPLMTESEIKAAVMPTLKMAGVANEDDDFGGRVLYNNGFLNVSLLKDTGQSIGNISFTFLLERIVEGLMHIPGLRGKAQRSYIATSFKNQIKGTFDLYSAGAISQWQQQKDSQSIIKVNSYLERLGLTNSVIAKEKNANEVELSVSRLPAGAKRKVKKSDMVNIADVGIGVSQVLPILVALIAAQVGQIVYVEQPELHLHPRAQVVMAELLTEAANRGVRVIVETHSSLLLLTLQTMVAEGTIKPEDVGLHWFERDAKGETKITLAKVDENGAYGDWPEDFGDVEFSAQRAYLNANTKRQPFISSSDEA